MHLPTQNPEIIEYTAICQKLIQKGRRNVPIVITTNAVKYSVILLMWRKSIINPVNIRPNVLVTPMKDTSKALSVPGIPFEEAKSGM